MVRLVDKPSTRRRVLDVQWHMHCHEFVYFVETTRNWCCAYWYAAQLVADENEDAA